MRSLRALLLVLAVAAVPTFAWHCAKDLDTQYAWKKEGDTCQGYFSIGTDAPSFQAIMPGGNAPTTTHGFMFKPDDGKTEARGESDCKTQLIPNEDTHFLKPLGLTDGVPALYFVSANRLARRKGIQIVGDHHLCCYDDLLLQEGEEVPATKCSLAKNSAPLQTKFVHYDLQHGDTCPWVFYDLLGSSGDCTFHDKTGEDKCIEFYSTSRRHTDTGCAPTKLGPCFGSSKAVAELNEGKLVAGAMANDIRSFDFNSPNKKGKPSNKVIPDPVKTKLTSQDFATMCCRSTHRGGRNTIVCGKAAVRQDQQVVTDDSRMGLPAKLNANGCFNFLNILNSADHTRLIVLELEAFYKAVAKSDSFVNWAALVLWSVFRASDQYEWLHSDDPNKNSQTNKAKFGFVMPPASLAKADRAWLIDTIDKASKHNLTFTAVDSMGKPQGCRKVSFYMSLVLEGRIKATRRVNRKWEAGRFAMKVIGSTIGLAASASPIPGTGPAAVAVVNMIDNLVGAIAQEQTARHSYKQVVIEAFLNMVDSILLAKEEEKKDDKKDDAPKKDDNTPKDDGKPKKGNDDDDQQKKPKKSKDDTTAPTKKTGNNGFLEVASAKRHKIRLQHALEAHRGDDDKEEDSFKELSPFTANEYFAKLQKYAEGDCSAEFYEIVRLFKFLFVEPTQEEAQLGKKTTQFFMDGTDMCHSKVGGDEKTVNSWRSMIRLHKKFVDGKWPGDMSSLDDAGGKVTRALMYWERVIGPAMVASQAVMTAMKPHMGLNKLWKDYAIAHNILQNGTTVT